jgi:hypothetical protein
VTYGEPSPDEPELESACIWKYFSISVINARKGGAKQAICISGGSRAKVLAELSAPAVKLLPLAGSDIPLAGPQAATGTAVLPARTAAGMC